MICFNAECHYAECYILFIIMLSVIMLNVVMLSVMALDSNPRTHKFIYRKVSIKQNVLYHQAKVKKNLETFFEKKM